MKFNLVDRITDLVPGQRITTVKALTLSEEYLADHFPAFPVMPGVLMLECMAQSAAWLVRVTENFAHSLVLLAEARNVTYKSFVAPGNVLTMEVECKSLDEAGSEFVGRGCCSDVEMVKARIKLAHVNLGSADPSRAALDRELVAHARRQFAILGGTASIRRPAPA